MGGEMSDTPRTDAPMGNMSVGCNLRWADSNVQLKRELAEAQEELNDKRKFCYDVEQALDGLKGDYVEIIKELRKDAEKFLFLMDQSGEFYYRGYWYQMTGKLREYIDAAMKEGK
jgi:hypothetical protein